MSDKDFNFKEFLDQLDPIGEAIRQADAGDKDSRRYLFEYIADRIKSNGAIDDGSQAMYQLRLWFTGELDKIIKAMPGKPGRPDKMLEHSRMAILVERARLNGMTQEQARA